MAKTTSNKNTKTYTSLNIVYIVLLIIWSLLFSVFTSLDLLILLTRLLATSCFGDILMLLLVFASPVLFIAVAVSLFLLLKKTSRKTQIIIFILGILAILFYFNNDAIVKLLFSNLPIAQNCALFG